MFKKNFFKILLLSIVLGQLCLGKPTNNEIDKETTSVKDLCHNQSNTKAMRSPENDSQLVPSAQLLTITINALVQMSKTYVEKAQLLSERLLKDPEIVNLDDNVEEVKDFIYKLQQFEKGCKIENINELFHSVDLYSTAISTFYEQEDAGKLSENGKIILKILKKYDTQKLEDEYAGEFNKFITKFEEKYENLQTALKEEKCDLKEKIIHWHEEFKTLKTYDEKVEAIAKFTTLPH